MNGIEERIRRSSPTPAQRNMPLTERAERELEALLNQTAKPAAAKSPRRGNASSDAVAAASSAEAAQRRRRRWILAACFAVFIGLVGYQVLGDLDALPVAQQESAETDGTESADADYPVYPTLEDALSASTLVVLGEPLESEARQDAGLHYTVTRFEISETLAGPEPQENTIEVRQDSSVDDPGSSISDYYVHLEDVESDQILLFLSEPHDGMYHPINPMDGIHTVDNGEISPMDSHVIELPETLDELREQVRQYEDAESQH